jgi:hypothetical protein
MSAKALSDLTGGRDFGNAIRENLLQRNRERTDAHPGGVIDRVRDGRAHADIDSSPRPCVPIGAIVSGSPTKITSIAGTSAFTATT